MNNKRRSGLQIMLGLIGLIKPLMGYMLLAIFMGSLGHLSATFITILGGYGILDIMGVEKSSLPTISLKAVFVIIIIFAVIRGILRYAEQACNHFIAFKLLAIIRHKIFAVLRQLAPAKLEGRDKGNLIAIITSDIELLEVFYAHTISPIAIAVVTSIIMIIYIGSLNLWFGVITLIGYILVGAVIPIINGKFGKKKGEQYREEFGELNTTVLDNLRGMGEILQYGQGKKRLSIMDEKTESLEKTQKVLKDYENVQRGVTETVIMTTGAAVAAVGTYMVSKGTLEAYEVILAVIAVMSSFGPTAALSSLSNNLNQTLACGNRVLNLLEETPQVEEVLEGAQFINGDIKGEEITFSYGEKEILSNFSIQMKKGSITGILGKSGCGKSTLLKLLMRFYDTNQGSICYGEQSVKDINTKSLRNHIAYVTQETFIFHDTIENNIKVAKLDATREEVIAAAKKASIHDFIETLPNGYDTLVSELGESLSGGEKQRIGIARAFLHDADIIFLDEPTSNLDSLNEGVILKSLKEERENQTIVLVSHRKSTMNISDKVVKM